MSMWQCKILARRGNRVVERTEIIDSGEDLTKYIGKDLRDKDEVAIIIQKQVSNGNTPLPRTERSRKKPWWKFWW